MQLLKDELLFEDWAKKRNYDVTDDEYKNLMRYYEFQAVVKLGRKMSNLYNKGLLKDRQILTLKVRNDNILYVGRIDFQSNGVSMKNIEIYYKK